MSDTISHPTSALGTRALFSLVAVVTAAILTAPPAYALSESQIKSDCEQNAGGHYSSYVRNGKRISQCCYKDIKGVMNCDYYVNGNYDGTQEWNALPPPNDTTPVGPPPEAVNPGPPVMANQP